LPWDSFEGKLSRSVEKRKTLLWIYCNCNSSQVKENYRRWKRVWLVNHISDARSEKSRLECAGVEKTEFRLRIHSTYVGYVSCVNLYKGFGFLQIFLFINCCTYKFSRQFLLRHFLLFQSFIHSVFYVWYLIHKIHMRIDYYFAWYVLGGL